MKTLEHWFLPNSNFDISRNKFYLEWKYGSHRPSKIEWVKTIPSNCNITKKITIQGGLPIIICGYLYNSPNTEPFQDLDSDFQYKKKSLLKSHLQKCVRLQLDCKAVRTAYYLMKLDINEFLRRLPIIAIEDSCIHIGIIVSIWFMCILDLINIQDYMVHYFNGLVRYITLSNHVDGDLTKIERKQMDTIKYWNLIDKLDNKPLKNILFSLMVRKSFGGMKGDMRMLEGTIITYLNNPHLYQSRMIDKIKTIRIHKSLYINDFELSAVDFHCYPIILTIINQKFPQYSNEDLKKCIWKYSSSLNKRIIEESKIGEYWNIWLQIKTDYRIIAKELLTQY